METEGGLAQFLEVRLFLCPSSPEICRGFSIVFQKSGSLIAHFRADLSQIHHFLLDHSVPFPSRNQIYCLLLYEHSTRHRHLRNSTDELLPSKCSMVFFFISFSQHFHFFRTGFWSNPTLHIALSEDLWNTYFKNSFYFSIILNVLAPVYLKPCHLISCKI